MKRNWRKYVASVLAMALIISAMSPAAFAEEPQEISAATNTQEESIAPLADTGYSVQDSTLTITSDAYADNLGQIIFNDGFKAGLTKVVVQEGVTALPDYAFQNLSNVTAITLPESLTTIGDWAFQNTEITEITIPAAVTSIGENAFANCNSLTTVKGYTDAVKTAAGDRYVDLSTAKIEQLKGDSAAVDLAHGIIAVKIPLQINKDKSLYHVKFTKAGVDTATTANVQEENGTYYVLCPVAAHQMTEEITAQLYYKADENAEENAVGESVCFTLASLLGDDLTEQQAALLNYGGYAQAAFGHCTEVLANSALSDEQKALDSVTAETVANYQPTAACEDKNFRVSANLSYGAAPELTLTIENADSLNSDTMTVTVKKVGEANEISNKDVQYSEGQVSVKIQNISMTDMDAMYEIALTNSETSAAVMQITYGVYSYVYDQLKESAQPEQSAVDLAKAMYLFYHSCDPS